MDRRSGKEVPNKRFSLIYGLILVLIVFITYISMLRSSIAVLLLIAAILLVILLLVLVIFMTASKAVSTC